MMRLVILKDYRIGSMEIEIKGSKTEVREIC